MNNLNKIFEPIKNSITPPESISPQNVIDILPPKKKNVYKFPIGKLLAACIPLLLATAIAITAVMLPGKVQYSKIPSVERRSDDNVMAVSDYSHLYKKMKTLPLSNRYYNNGWNSDGSLDMAENAAPQSPGDEKTLATTTSKEKPSHSETNLQVMGVDEGDYVKTDGKYLYVISVSDAGENVITIIEPSENGKMKMLSQLVSKNGEGSGGELYIQNDMLIITGNIATKSEARLYDITDRTNPVLKKSFIQDGHYSSSRIIGNKLYLISTSGAETNTKISVPSVEENGETYKIPSDCIYTMEKPVERQFLNISCIDTQDMTQNSVSQSLFGAGGTVFSSLDNLFISSYNQYDGITTFLKFNYNGEGVEFIGSAQVYGSVLNQYSMDEHDGYFRAAVTAWGWNNANPDSKNEDSNSIYIFDKNMKKTGEVTGLAKNEDIKSCRFMGSMAYIVTFRRIDPLFAIDLSDPAKPKVLGELKIPGFSQYLHPYKDGYLIGIGVDGNDDGMVFGIKLSLFDINDPTNPVEKAKYTFKSQTMNLILDSAKAFMFDSEKDIFAFPIQDWTENYKTSVQAVRVSENGFEPLYNIAEPNSASYYNYNQWVRSAYIGDTFYALFNGTAVSADYATGKPLETLRLIKTGESNPYAREIK